MERSDYRSTSASASQMLVSFEQQSDEKREVQSYCAPQMFLIGKAVDLMKNDISAPLADGADGWYVWGS